jgi:hypothetical protein
MRIGKFVDEATCPGPVTTKGALLKIVAVVVADNGIIGTAPLSVTE